jgi:GNAT superfamily N-acetyltransferase
MRLLGRQTTGRSPGTKLLTFHPAKNSLCRVWKRQIPGKARCLAWTVFSQANGSGSPMCAARLRPGRCFLALPVVPHTPDKGDYVSVERYPFALRLAVPGDLDEVRGLALAAAEWLRTSKDTDQWAKPWPDQAGQRERMLNDLLKGKTWIVWDGTTAAATITVDTEEPLDLNEQPVWPAHKRHEPTLYVRRVIVSRRYAGLGLGAALLDWAADVAQREHDAALLRIDVWTTNTDLHAYYEGQRFIRREGRAPRELANYPSQALFEREVDGSGSGYMKYFSEEDPGERRSN